MFFKAVTEIKNTISNYFDSGNELIEKFCDALYHYYDHGNTVKFETMVSEIEQLEESADNILHKISNLLYKKSLLPDSREDILKLLENYDDILDSAMHTLLFLYTRNISVPSELKDEFIEITDISKRCYFTTNECSKKIFGKHDNNIKNLTKKINDDESLCDTLETKLMYQLFRLNISEYDKIILSQFTSQISKISDYCEDCADLITIINVKRVI